MYEGKSAFSPKYFLGPYRQTFDSQVGERNDCGQVFVGLQTRGQDTRHAKCYSITGAVCLNCEVLKKTLTNQNPRLPLSPGF